jgi:hypothetical protein
MNGLNPVIVRNEHGNSFHIHSKNLKTLTVSLETMIVTHSQILVGNEQ